MFGFADVCTLVVTLLADILAEDSFLEASLLEDMALAVAQLIVMPMANLANRILFIIIYPMH